jgi:hypothetical protein
MQRVLAKPLPISSVIIDQSNKIYFRIAGPAGSLEGVVERILALLPNRASAAVESDEGSQRQQFVSWLQGSLNADESLIRIGMSPKNVPQLQPILADCQHFYAAACSIAWAKLSNGQLAEKDRLLQQQGLSAVAMNGSASQPFWGDRSWLNMARRIQQAIDPNNRFLQWA